MITCEQCCAAPAVCEVEGPFSNKSPARRFLCVACYEEPLEHGRAIEGRLVAVYQGSRRLLTRQQLDRITFLLYGFWEDDEDKDGEFDEDEFERQFPKVLAQVESPEELHHYASHYNWDDGETNLEKIIDHPLCDQGTALMLFWLGRPDYSYGQEAKGEISVADDESLAFLKKLPRKYLGEGFPSRRIRIDPRSMFGHDHTQPEADSTGMDLVPEAMKVASPGEPLERIPM